jgi:RNA polymerase sigma-70 factor (ECF subfamily)
MRSVGYEDGPGARNIGASPGHYPSNSYQGAKMADDETRWLERQRFEKHYREQFGPVGAYLLARADRDLASEAISKTFEVAWRRIADMPQEPLPWLLGVARKVLADLRRTQGRQDALVERIAASSPDATGDHADGLIGREGVLAALGRLTDLQQEVLLLIAWDGLAQREAATVLGCSRGAVALRVHRARRRLELAMAEIAQEEQAPLKPSGGSAPRSSTPNASVTQEATR